MVEEQIKKWEMRRQLERKQKETWLPPLITISREAGSAGVVLARKLAEELDLDLFDREILNQIAESAEQSEAIIETLDEKGHSFLDDWIASLVSGRDLWPDQYLKVLMKVTGTIGEHGKAVIVGRGACFVLPPARTLRIRVVAPLADRITCWAQDREISQEEARKLVSKEDAERRAFVRKYFHTDTSDPLNYDLLVNLGNLPMNAAVEAVKAAWKNKPVRR